MRPEITAAAIIANPIIAAADTIRIDARGNVVARDAYGYETIRTMIEGPGYTHPGAAAIRALRAALRARGQTVRA